MRLVVQEEQLGTGHAVMQARSYIKNLKEGYVMVLWGTRLSLRPVRLRNSAAFAARVLLLRPSFRPVSKTPRATAGS
jgi:bifunctional N-acetylglucosamine-1-phosphate-uridyltransferase/glucosamine-1-phosphate-acetyltransferase GlmU-like protein